MDESKWLTSISVCHRVQLSIVQCSSLLDISFKYQAVMLSVVHNKTTFKITMVHTVQVCHAQSVISNNHSIKKDWICNLINKQVCCYRIALQSLVHRYSQTPWNCRITILRHRPYCLCLSTAKGEFSKPDFLLHSNHNSTQYFMSV